MSAIVRYDLFNAMKVLIMITAALAFGQATMKQLMVDMIHPASNDILLFAYRGAPKDDAEWGRLRRSALALSEAGNLLASPGRSPDQGAWAKSAKAMADVGAAAYRAAQKKDGSALPALAEPLDASCTGCHRQYRPNVFPRQGASR